MSNEVLEVPGHMGLISKASLIYHVTERNTLFQKCCRVRRAFDLFMRLVR